jgi:putative phosphoribosyl transferase
MEPFADRAAAGGVLAERLFRLAGREDVLVLGLPRGGVVVAARVAERLGADLDVVVVRKLRTPGHAELAMGAIAVWGEHVSVIRNSEVISRVGISDEAFAEARLRELDVARHRASEWGQLPPQVQHRIVLLVDDGLATGATMRAALDALRAADAGWLIVAVPVGAPEELRDLEREADQVVSVQSPDYFRAVGVHYRDFGQVDDATVQRELSRARERTGRARAR